MRIIGTGGFLPEDVLTNHDVEKLCDTNDEWITKRTGIRQRHVARDGVGASELGTHAAQMALDNAGVSPSELDVIICCTLTPDQIAPATAILIQANLGASNAAAFDLNAACSGFVYGLATARGFVETGIYRTILLIGSETTTRLLNWEDRDTAVLFADGAGAVVLRGEEGDRGVLATHLGADGSSAGILCLPGGGFKHKPTVEYLSKNPMRIEMNGPELFKRAVVQFEQAALIVLKETQLSMEDIDLFIPHQANARIIEATRRKLGMEAERVIVNIDKVGNTMAASIPLALHHANQEGKIKPGNHILIAGFGAGLTWGSSIVRW